MNKKPIKWYNKSDTAGVAIWIVLFIILWLILGGWEGISGRG